MTLPPGAPIKYQLLSAARIGWGTTTIKDNTQSKYHRLQGIFPSSSLHRGTGTQGAGKAHQFGHLDGGVRGGRVGALPQAA